MTFRISFRHRRRPQHVLQRPTGIRSNFWLCKTSQEPSELGILGAESSRAMRLLHVWLICWLPSWAWGSPEAFPVKDVQTWSVVLETGKMSLKKGHDRLLDFSQAYATTMPKVAVVSYSGWLVNFQVGMNGLHKVLKFKSWCFLGASPIPTVCAGSVCCCRAALSLHKGKNSTIQREKISWYMSQG